jgi:hypothetical protein
MIVEPHELQYMARELDDGVFKEHSEKLIKFHLRHRVNVHSEVNVPMYWAETILTGLKKIQEGFPQMRFGSILEEKNKLKMFTIPTHTPVNKMKIVLYNEIDKLILSTITGLTKGNKKPNFLS